MQSSFVRRNTPVRRRKVTARSFLRAVANGRATRFVKCQFTDKLELANLSFASLIEFEDCEFLELFEASGAMFRMGLSFVRCKFQKSITLESAKIYGDLVLTRGTIMPPEGFDEHPNLDLPPYHPPPRFRAAKCGGLVVKGNLVADHLDVYGSMDLGHIEIHGALLMRGVHIGLNVPGRQKFGGRLYVRQASIDGDFELEPFTDESLEKASRRSVIDGSLSIGASLIKGRLNIRGIDIRGCLHAITVKIEGRLLGDCWQHPNPQRNKMDAPYRTTIGSIGDNKSSIFFHDGTVDEAVWLHGIQAKGALEFENARIGGALEISSWPRATEQPVGHVFPSEVGKNAAHESIVFKNAHIAANIVLDGIQASGRIAGHNSRIGAAFLCRPKRYRLLACQQHAPQQPLPPDESQTMLCRPDVGATEAHHKSLSLYGAHVGSNIEISGSVLHGGVRMRYAKIAGAVIAQNWEGEDDLGSSQSGHKGEAQHTEIGFTERGQSLYLYGAEIGGNLCVQDALLWGYLSLELAHVKGSAILSGSSFCMAAAAATPGSDAVTLKKIQAYQELTRRNACENYALEEAAYGLRLAKARIDNDVKLDLVRVEKNVSANGCHILGDLLFGQKPADGAEEPPPEAPGAVSGTAAEAVTKAGSGTSCVIGCATADGKAFVKDGVQLVAARISGDVVLRGLETPRVDMNSAVLGKLTLSLEEWDQHSAGGADQQLTIDLTGFEFSDLEPDVVKDKYKSRSVLVPAAVRLFKTYVGAHTHQGMVKTLSPEGEVPAPSPFRSSWHLLCKVRPSAVRSWLRLLAVWVWHFFWKSSLMVVSTLGVLLLLFLGPEEPFFREQSWLAVKSLVFLFFCPPLIALTRWVFKSLFTWLEPLQRTNPYAALLSRGKLDISTYTRVEDWLANQGDPREADGVHHAMRQRELMMPTDELPDIRWMWKWLYFVCAGAGTRVKRLLWAHLAVFLFTWLAVFSNPGSVEHPATYVVPSTMIPHSKRGHDGTPLASMLRHVRVLAEAVLPGSNASHSVLDRQAHVFWAGHNGDAPGMPWSKDERDDYLDQKRDLRHSAGGSAVLRGQEDWTQADAFWVALNVQIPLVHFWARDEWEPAAEKGCFGTWFGVHPLHIQYDTLAGLIQIFSYLTIPMIIASGTRTFKRRGSS